VVAVQCGGAFSKMPLPPIAAVCGAVDGSDYSSRPIRELNEPSSGGIEEKPMQDEMVWEVRMPSIRFDRVRELKAEKRFAGRVELRKVVSDGPWDLVAIVGCEREADATLLAMISDGQL
jgi:hypothetical protein